MEQPQQPQKQPPKPQPQQPGMEPELEAGYERMGSRSRSVALRCRHHQQAQPSTLVPNTSTKFQLQHPARQQK